MCGFLSRGEREGKSCERDRDAHICATSQSSVLPSTARERGELLRVYIGGSTTKRSRRGKAKGAAYSSACSPKSDAVNLERDRHEHAFRTAVTVFRRRPRGDKKY